MSTALGLVFQFSKWQLNLKFLPSIEYPKYFSPKLVYWFYNFQSKQIEVHREYLLIDDTELIGYIGGTLGLFVGFSFRDVIVYVLNFLRDLTFTNHI